jgi:predicted cupin superfamily sugar epimerase
MLCGNMQDTRLDAQYWIDHLKLSPHPEGGYFRATYKADLMIPHSALPSTFGGNRAASTAIYFLLEGKDFSAFHRIAADEVWHFYAGNSLVVYVIDAEGNASELHLGSDAGFQAVVKAGCWFASRLKEPVGFALVGCTVAPGFEFEDFELAERHELVRIYPAHRKLIEELTRE